MADPIRVIIESPIRQGVDEEVVYVLRTTPWGTVPILAQVFVFRGGLDVSGDVLVGAVSVVDDDISSPKVLNLENEVQYRLEYRFVVGGNVLEAAADLIGEL